MAGHKHIRFLIFILSALATIPESSAQLLNYDKLNRTELREQLAVQLGRVDSLYREVVKANIDLKKSREENAQLVRTINATEVDMDGLLKDIGMMRAQVKGLEATLREKEKSLSQIRLKADSLLTASRKQEEAYRGSLSVMKATVDSLKNSLEAAKGASAWKSSMAPEEDFLTRYLRTPFPLNDNLFTFSLQKVLLGDKEFEGSEYYDGEAQRSPLSGLPEIIDLSDLSAERPAAIALTREMEPHEFLKEAKVPQLMMDFPTLEITRNKLVTLRYPGGKEESLMFNFVKQAMNNGRISGHFTMVAERKELSEEENALDIKWNLYAIGNQVFIALTRGQLLRIGINFRNFDEHFVIVDKEYSNVGARRLSDLNLDYYRSRYFLTGTDLYLVRKQDPFMENPVYLNPDACIFLFKLNKLR